jgi:hypothetical protein
MKPTATQVLNEIGAMILVLALAAGIGFVAGQESCRRDCYVVQR